MSHIQTKSELTQNLAGKAIEHVSQEAEICFIVVSGTEARSNHADLSEELQEHSHEETDTLIILHSVDVSRKSTSHLDVYLPDTDVFLLLISWYPNLCDRTRFITGKRSSQHIIDIKTAFDAPPPEKAKCLLGFHPLTGSDTTGRFAGKTKGTCFKTFLSCSPRILLALRSLGRERGLPCQETTEALEEYVCRIYSPRTRHTRISELRWYMFSQKHAEGERLPPTRGTLLPHIWRAHYLAMIWTHADQSNPQLPTPTDTGWTESDGAFWPVICLEPPAPESVLLLIKCACQKGCSTRKCNCNSTNPPRTDLCGCSDECQNTPDITSISESFDIDDDNSDVSDEGQ